MQSLKFKRVLITGAARGIGKAMAQKFAAAGAELVLTDLDGKTLEATARELADAGATCRTYVLDVTDATAVLDVRDRVHGEAGTLDILINNAGVVFGGPFLDVPLERHRLTYRVNIEGVVAMTHAFLPDLIAAPRGHLVNIASASGFVGVPRASTYASSKWAVIGFSDSIRLELKALGHKNVDVTAVCPLFVNTGMFEGAAPPRTTRMLDPDKLAAKVVEAVRKRQVWVLEPFLAKVAPVLKNCLPTWASDAVSDLFGGSHAMDEWQGHGSASR